MLLKRHHHLVEQRTNRYSLQHLSHQYCIDYAKIFYFQLSYQPKLEHLYSTNQIILKGEHDVQLDINYVWLVKHHALYQLLLLQLQLEDWLSLAQLCSQWSFVVQVLQQVVLVHYLLVHQVWCHWLEDYSEYY